MKKSLGTINAKRLFTDILSDIAGGMLIAIGIYNFASHADLPVTGITGICLIIYRLFGLPIGLCTIILNIPIALICYRLLGRGFFLRSIKSMVISSVIIDTVAPLLPTYSGDRLLAAVCAGVLSGLGYAIIYLSGSSSGGSDFIIMAVRAVKPHLSLGNISFVSDSLIILAGGYLFSDVDGIIYGMIMAFLLSRAVDKVMYGISQGKLALIVTDKSKAPAMAAAIEKSCGRGATLLNAVGSYTNAEKQVVMCACDSKQMFLVRKAASLIDPNSFTIVLESSEVLGEGFKT